jgi:pimeloyl-ACP methyl ester carboxylesterase
VNKLNLEQVVLIGHSMGAPVVLEAARRMPQRVIGQVGVDYLFNFEFKYSEEFLRNFFSDFRSNFIEAMEKLVPTMFTSDSDPVLIGEIVKDMSSAPPEVGIAASEAIANFINNEIIQVLSDVKAPITCINSDTNPTNVETNQRYVPSFKAKIMFGVGHFNMMEDPETFNRLLEETVQEFVQIAQQK